MVERIILSMLVVLVALLVSLNPSLYFQLQSPSISVLWVAHSNPSDGDDSAQATCVLGDILLVFGFDSSPGDFQFRIESRSASSGVLLGVWTRNPGSGNETLIDCTVMNGYAYVAGATITVPPKAYVLKVDSSLNVEVKDLGWIGLSSTIESSGSYLYVGGGDLRGLNLVFRIDKLDSSLSRIASYKSQGLSGHHTVIADMAFNKVTGHLWAVGVALNESGDRWWIELVDPQSMAFIKSIDPKVPGTATVVLADDDGFIYVIGDRGYVVKFESDGGIALRVELRDFTPTKGAILGDLLVIGGHEQSNGYYRHTIYILDKDLNVKGKSYLSEGVNADSYLLPGRMWVEGVNLYLAGMDREPGNYRWVVYSLKLVGVEQTTTITLTVTTTTTTTHTVIQPTTITSTVTVTTTTTNTMTTTATKTITTTQTYETTITTTITTTHTVTQPTTTTYTITREQTVTQVIPTTLTKTVTQLKEETKTITDIIPTTLTIREYVTETREITRTTTKTQEITREQTRITTTTITQINLPISALLLIIGLVVGGIIARFLFSK